MAPRMAPTITPTPIAKASPCWKGMPSPNIISTELSENPLAEKHREEIPLELFMRSSIMRGIIKHDMGLLSTVED